MLNDGGEGTSKVLRISLSLLALKTETEGCDGFGTCLFCKRGNEGPLFNIKRLGVTGKLLDWLKDSITDRH